MKKLTFLAMACSMFISVGAQTLKVNIGDVTYAFPAQQTGDMLFESDNLLNICGKSFAISEISNMTVDQSSVTDNFIDVVYADNSAKVVVPGNVAKYLTVKVSEVMWQLSQTPIFQRRLPTTLPATHQMVRSICRATRALP